MPLVAARLDTDAAKMKAINPHERTVTAMSDSELTHCIETHVFGENINDDEFMRDCMVELARKVDALDSVAERIARLEQRLGWTVFDKKPSPAATAGDSPENPVDDFDFYCHGGPKPKQHRSIDGTGWTADQLNEAATRISEWYSECLEHGVHLSVFEKGKGELARAWLRIPAAPPAVPPDAALDTESDVMLLKWNNPAWRSWASQYSDHEYREAELYVALKTEQTMHSAWRKRAEEAEAELATLRAAVPPNAALAKIAHRLAGIVREVADDYHAQSHEGTIEDCQADICRDNVDALSAWRSAAGVRTYDRATLTAAAELFRSRGFRGVVIDALYDLRGQPLPATVSEVGT